MTEQPNEAENLGALLPPAAAGAPRDYVTIVDVPHKMFAELTPEALAQHGAQVWLERVDALGYVPIFEPVEGSAETAVHMKMNLRSPQLEEHYLHVSGPVTAPAPAPMPES